MGRGGGRQEIVRRALGRVNVGSSESTGSWRLSAGGCSESPRSSQCWRFGENWVVAVVDRQEVRRALGCGGRSSQCWRFGEHWVVAVVGRRLFGEPSVESKLEVRRALDRGGGRSAGGSESPWLRRSVESMLAVWRALSRGGGRLGGCWESPWLRRSVESMLAVRRALGRGGGRQPRQEVVRRALGRVNVGGSESIESWRWSAGGCLESPRSSQCWRFGEH